MVFKCGTIFKQKQKCLVICIPAFNSIQVKCEYFLVCFTVGQIVILCSDNFGSQCIPEKVSQYDFPWRLKTTRDIKLLS